MIEKSMKLSEAAKIVGVSPKVMKQYLNEAGKGMPNRLTNGRYTILVTESEIELARSAHRLRTLGE